MSDAAYSVDPSGNGLADSYSGAADGHPSGGDLPPPPASARGHARRPARRPWRKRLDAPLAGDVRAEPAGDVYGSFGTEH